MNSISYINSEISSHIVNEDYFAIKVVYDSSIELTNIARQQYGVTVARLMKMMNRFAYLNLRAESSSVSFAMTAASSGAFIPLGLGRNTLAVPLSPRSAYRTMLLPSGCQPPWKDTSPTLMGSIAFSLVMSD